MTIAEALLDYFGQFDLLAGGVLHLDFLPELAAEYAIEITPSDTIVERYLDGTAVKQQDFVLCSRVYYNDEVTQAIDNSGFFEALKAWHKQQSRAGRLPTLGTARTAEWLQLTTCGYLLSTGGNTARYQIQGKLQYEEK